MKLLPEKLGCLPPALLLLTAHAAAQIEIPTAIRKMPPDSNEKFLPEYVAFASDASGNPSFQAALFAREAGDARGGGSAVATTRGGHDGERDGETTIPRLRPAIRPHYEGEATQWELLRRAGEALKILAKREACPANMDSCANVGHPNKCCFTNERCVSVEDSTVGNVACCPENANCGGGVGACPTGAVTCPAELGGGCCLKGYICKGEGCK
jgi:progranulin